MNQIKKNVKLETSLEVEKGPPTKGLLRSKSYYTVRPILDIQATSHDDIVVKYGNKAKRDWYRHTCCGEDIQGEARKVIRVVEGQLFYEMHLRSKLPGLKFAGLCVDMARRGLELAELYASCYESFRNKQLARAFIYRSFVCGPLHDGLQVLIMFLLCGKMTDENEKEEVGKWIVHIHGKCVAACILTGEHERIEEAKEKAREANVIMFEKGLGHLLTNDERREATKFAVIRQRGRARMERGLVYHWAVEIGLVDVVQLVKDVCVVSSKCAKVDDEDVLSDNKGSLNDSLLSTASSSSSSSSLSLSSS